MYPRYHAGTRLGLTEKFSPRVTPPAAIVQPLCSDAFWMWMCRLAVVLVAAALLGSAGGTDVTTGAADGGSSGNPLAECRRRERRQRIRLRPVYYRPKARGECNCCVSCWTCVVPLSSHYDCARRNNVPVRNVSRHIGTYRVGERVSWSMSGIPGEGWLRSCVSHQALHDTGLRFHDDASLSGTITPLAEEQIWFTAFHTAGGTVIRLNLHLYVRTHRPPAEAGFDHVDPRVSAGADAAVAHYRAWEQRRESHADTIRGMNEEFAKMKRVLDQRPTTGKGFGWGVLGALHMNTHKLLENVLLEAELYLGLALTFGGRSAAFAEQNLEGCYAKRRSGSQIYLV